MSRVAAGAVVVLSALILAVFFARVVPMSLDGREPEDFPNYYISGLRIMDGRPVYGDIDQEVELLLGWTGYRAYPADPPVTLGLLAPLSGLPYAVAWWTMAVVSLASIGLVMLSVARRVGYGWWIAAAVAAAALASNPVRFLLRRNHFEALVLVAGFLGWRAWRERRTEAAGAWWGIATALKLFPGLWLVGLAGARRHRALAWGAGTALLVSLAGILAVGIDDAAAFVVEVIPRSRRWYGTVGNYSLLSFGTAIAGPWLGWAMTAIGAAIIVPRYLTSSHGPDSVWVCGTAAALLLSPLSWLNYLILVLPCLVVLAARLDLGQRRNRLLLAALTLGFAWWPPVVALGGLVPTVLVSSAPTYALAGLFWVGSTLRD